MSDSPHTPPTQAELDEWKKEYAGSGGRTERLVAEVERLNELAHFHEVTTFAVIERLTKEVEELRKDKERLDACLARKRIRIQKHEYYNSFNHEHVWKDLFNRNQIDVAIDHQNRLPGEVERK